MKNIKLQNFLKAIFIYPILLLAVLLIFLINDMTIKETYEDVTRGFFR